MFLQMGRARTRLLGGLYISPESGSRSAVKKGSARGRVPGPSLWGAPGCVVGGGARAYMRRECVENSPQRVFLRPHDERGAVPDLQVLAAAGGGASRSGRRSPRGYRPTHTHNAHPHRRCLAAAAAWRATCASRLETWWEMRWWTLRGGSSAGWPTWWRTGWRSLGHCSSGGGLWAVSLQADVIVSVAAAVQLKRCSFLLYELLALFVGGSGLDCLVEHGLEEPGEPQ